MKYFIYPLLIIISNHSISQELYKNSDVPLFNTFENFTFIHIVGSNNQVDKEIKKFEKIGEIEKYPEKFSKNFDEEVRKSMRNYDDKNYVMACSVLDKAILNEPENPFIANTYARACYNIDREKSFKIYVKLIHQLDSTYNSSVSNPVIDVWFREAYWKLSTLYLDKKEWHKASFEISRFLATIKEAIGEKIYIQALEYLTECAFMTYDDTLAKHLANRVLFYDSKNQFAKEVLSNLKN